MRKSGVLLPISALPGGYGIGCFDEAAYRFVDNLAEAKQTYWQILPLGITGYGDSPYQSFSTFAGNPYFISLDALVKKGWLKAADLPDPHLHREYVDYEDLWLHRYQLLKKAYTRSHIKDDQNFREYCENNQWWLDDYALFMAIKAEHHHQSWQTWSEELRLRDPQTLKQKREELKDEITYQQFLQYLMWSQWYELKAYANAKGIRIIGDIPIYVAYDSSDVWSAPELFQLDQRAQPTAVAGVPPDGFSADGQLWGNPLYDWDKHKRTNYQWWIRRIRYCTQAYDIVRIDHFRGFDEYFSIPYGDKTAVNGVWKKGPGIDLFRAAEKALGKLHVIAEDLGYLTPSVKKLLKDTGYPGMKLLQFAFDSRDSSGAANYLPERYPENSVVYTGTHDNETMMGWFDDIKEEELQSLKDYLHTDTSDKAELLDQCITLIMTSKSDTCIIPMQDYLKLDNKARMNTPNTLGHNWMWRMPADAMDEQMIRYMRDLIIRSHRC